MDFKIPIAVTTTDRHDHDLMDFEGPAILHFDFALTSSFGRPLYLFVP